MAEVLFNELRRRLLPRQYDDERAGDFKPLRLVPKHKTVVLRPRHQQGPAISNRGKR